jgi:hypothetical protein
MIRPEDFGHLHRGLLEVPIDSVRDHGPIGRVAGRSGAADPFCGRPNPLLNRGDKGCDITAPAIRGEEHPEPSFTIFECGEAFGRDHMACV